MNPVAKSVSCDGSMCHSPALLKLWYLQFKHGLPRSPPDTADDEVEMEVLRLRLKDVCNISAHTASEAKETPGEVKRDLDAMLRRQASQFEYCDRHLGKNEEHAYYKLGNNNDEKMQILAQKDGLYLAFSLGKHIHPDLMTVTEEHHDHMCFQLKLLNASSLPGTTITSVECRQYRDRRCRRGLQHIRISIPPNTALAVAVLHTLLYKYMLRM